MGHTTVIESSKRLERFGYLVFGTRTVRGGTQRTYSVALPDRSALSRERSQVGAQALPSRSAKRSQVGAKQEPVNKNQEQEPGGRKPSATGFPSDCAWLDDQLGEPVGENGKTSPLDAALILFYGRAANVNGMGRAKAEALVPEHGEERVCEAIRWAATAKRPIGEAWARVRKATWNAGDASIPRSSGKETEAEREARVRQQADEAWRANHDA